MATLERNYSPPGAKGQVGRARGVPSPPPPVQAGNPPTLSEQSDFIRTARHLANVDPIGANCT